MNSENKNNSILFACDDNLGKLARYLRVGGFDTFFCDKIIDNSLVRLALDENRIILTRDSQLIKRRLVRRYELIISDHWPNQLRFVMDRFNLGFTIARLFTRCLEDNALINRVEKESVIDRVYPYTYENHTKFKECPLCQRIYWSGTHTRSIISRLEKNGFTIYD